MINKTLLKEAIADAKTVRETALAQAKIALEEAFAPRLQSMFAAKLREEMEEETGSELEELAGLDLEEVQTEEAKDNLEDEIDLDEILAELESENEGKKSEEDEKPEEKEEKEDEEKPEGEEPEEEKEVSELSMDELEELIRDIVSQEVGNGEDGEGEEVPLTAPEDGKEDNLETLPDEDIDLDEILAELMGDEDSDVEEEIKEVKNYEDEARKKMEEEYHVALENINTLRQELQEVNLLNAKLLYVNKLFKDKTLNESQKLKVIKAFDKAESAKEAKLVYESLSSTFSVPSGKSQLKENLGFASKSTGVPSKQAIVETNGFVARMQKLANI